MANGKTAVRAADKSQEIPAGAHEPSGYHANTPHEKLTKLLYVLMRDRVPVGVVEQIIVDYCEQADDWRRGFHSTQYKNRQLEALAREIVDRLMKPFNGST